MGRAVLTLTFLCAATLSTGPAAAGLRVCNKSDRDASIAWASASFNHSLEVFTTAVLGWADVAAGTCETLNSTPGRTLFNGRPTSVWYVYARATLGGHWGASRSDHPITDYSGRVWEITMNFCEPDPNGMLLDDLQKSCNRLPYTIVDDYDGRDYQVELRQ